MTPNAPFRSEAEFVRWMTRRAAKRSLGLTLGIGDDAALIAPTRGRELILTTDMSIENVHFTRALHPPRAVGHRALARSLSDVAAMGGTPRYALLSLAISRDLERRWLEGCLNGIFGLARRFATALIGGDTSMVDGATLLDVMVAGEVPRGQARLRSAARPGDGIYVSGRLGMAAWGLRLLRDGPLPGGMKRPNPAERAAIAAHLYPQPQCALGRFLAQSRIPNAMMDLSDGLSIDLHRICTASSVGALLYEHRIPAPPLGDAHDALALALNGGEDYQLLFTVPAAKVAKVPTRFGRIPLRCIGEIQSARGVHMVRHDGKTIPVMPAGYDHFARNTHL